MEWETWDEEVPRQPYCHEHCTYKADGSVTHVHGCPNRPVPWYVLWQRPVAPHDGTTVPKPPGPYRSREDVRDAVLDARTKVESMTKLSDVKRRVLLYVLAKIERTGMSEVGMGSADAKALGLTNLHKHLRDLTEPTRWGFRRQPLIERRLEPRMRQNVKANARHRRSHWYWLRDTRGRIVTLVDDGVELPRNPPTPTD